MQTETLIIVLTSLIPVIAFMYASVGHGGASGYLALMSLMGISQDVMKPTALILNMVVSAIAFLYFYKAGFFKFRVFLLFALGSIPFSFLGGLIKTDPYAYKVILAVFLLIATLKLSGILDPKKDIEKPHRYNIPLALSIGAVIGFFSGLIGIGGGIILSPVLLLLRWVNIKEAAAISALFIWVNSFSGFMGQLYRGVEISGQNSLFIALALCGGLAGSYYGTFKFNQPVLRKILAAVLVFASIKLIVIS